MKSRLEKLATSKSEMSSTGVLTLLLKDHREMKSLMAKVKSHRSTPAGKESSFRLLVQLVRSHVKAEEKSLLNKLKTHERFEDEAIEGIEEHRIHAKVIGDIYRIQDRERRQIRMKIFCEFLEHHLREEEKDLFPRFKKYSALTTRKKMGKVFLDKRKQSSTKGARKGALADG
jgi:hemerythrin superfamily protein